METMEEITADEYLRGGRDIHIRFTIVHCPLGLLLVGATDKGICAVSIGRSDEALEAALFTEYPGAVIKKDKAGLGEYVAALLKYLDGSQPDIDLPIDLPVTAFQWRVYEALRAIPFGQTRSYEEVAAAIGSSKSVRAVARACAKNPVAIVIPCHRVLRKDGSLAGYRWGLDNKKALLAKEMRLKTVGTS